jgi:hypothetical protein
MAILGTVAYTQLGAHTSYALLATSLFVRGIGFGFVMMPAVPATGFLGRQRQSTSGRGSAGQSAPHW